MDGIASWVWGRRLRWVCPGIFVSAGRPHSCWVAENFSPGRSFRLDCRLCVLKNEGFLFLGLTFFRTEDLWFFQNSLHLPILLSLRIYVFEVSSAPKTSICNVIHYVDLSSFKIKKKSRALRFGRNARGKKDQVSCCLRSGIDHDWRNTISCHPRSLQIRCKEGCL